MRVVKLSSAPFSMDPSIPTMENSYVPYSTIPVNANPVRIWLRFDHSRP